MSKNVTVSRKIMKDIMYMFCTPFAEQSEVYDATVDLIETVPKTTQRDILLEIKREYPEVTEYPEFNNWYDSVK